MKTNPQSAPDFEKFRQFVRGIVNVPHSELKAALDAEKKAKARKRATRAAQKKK
jgi:hypothetical protein